MPFTPWTYVAILVGTAGMSLVLTPLALKVALRRGLVDDTPPPGQVRVPYLGGLAIVAAFSAAVLAVALLRPPNSGLGELAAILGLSIGLSVVGLVDDLRRLGPAIRVAAELLAGLGLWVVGVRVGIFGHEVADLAVTLLWVLGVTNAFNLLDNMDGLSAGIAAVAAGSFFLIAAVNGQFLVAALAIALAGCALGFLRHNFHPARIYMGDAGSLFLGFLLAVIGIKLRFDAPTRITFFVPILVLGVAIFDTTLVTITRLLHGRSPFRGGRDHVSHRLVKIGIPVPVAVGLIYGAGGVLGWLGLVMSRVDVPTGFLLMGLILVVGLALGILLGAVPVYETSQGRHFIIRELEQHQTIPPTDDRDVPAQPVQPRSTTPGDAGGHTTDS